MKKHMALIIVIGATIFLLIAAFFLFRNMTEKTTHLFLLPEGYTGWVEVVFDRPDSPPLKSEDHYLVYEIPRSGEIYTSSSNITGPMAFYYIDENGTRKKIPNNVPMIHGLGTKSGTGMAQALRFFVGAEEQWKDRPTP